MLFYPTSLYQSCRARLVECERHKGTDIPGRPGLKDMWDNFKLQNIHVSRGQLAETCVCDICTARRAHVGQPGTSKQDLVHKKIVPKGEESNAESAEIKRVRCSKCLQEVGRGISHPCSSVSKKRNLVDLVSEQEGHAPEQIVAAVMKKIATEKDIQPEEDISLQQIDGCNKLTLKFAAKSNTNYKKTNTDIKAATVANVK